MEKCFEVLTPHWLDRAHLYNGSIGTAFHSFNYRMEMDGKERVVRAAAYSGRCYEAADDVETREFPWDDAGVEQMKQWLQERYEAYLARENSD